MKKVISAVLALCMSLGITTTAFAAPQPSPAFKSDTGTKVNIEAGKSYQFKITALNSKKPALSVSGKSFTVQANGSKGQNYYFVVKAVGKSGSNGGVYIDGEKNPSTIVTITAPKTSSNSSKSSFKINTASKLTIPFGKTYQFKVTSNAKPTFSVGNTSVFKIVSSKSSGNTYYFTVKANGKTGQSAGVYINGTRVTVCTIGK